jgi:hypothetical protein
MTAGVSPGGRRTDGALSVRLDGEDMVQPADLSQRSRAMLTRAKKPLPYKGIRVGYRWARRMIFGHIVVVKWSWILAAMPVRTQVAPALPEDDWSGKLHCLHAILLDFVLSDVAPVVAADCGSLHESFRAGCLPGSSAPACMWHSVLLCWSPSVSPGDFEAHGASWGARNCAVGQGASDLLIKRAQPSAALVFRGRQD